MTIDIQYTSSEANRVNKQILGLTRLEGALRNNSNTTDPEILIEGNIQDMAGANYLTIYSFKRHYFIRNIESICNGLYLIRAHVDVLTTFATAIKGNSAIIHRQANSFNLYLDDGVMKVYQNPIVETYEFPQGFSGHMYVLTVAG